MNIKANTHTEAEASLLWCPHVKLPMQFQATKKGAIVGAPPETFAIAAAATNVEPAGLAGAGGFARPGPHTGCIGRLCAMWRWASDDDDDQQGYCGLAGR